MDEHARSVLAAWVGSIQAESSRLNGVFSDTILRESTKADAADAFKRLADSLADLRKILARP